MPTSNQLQPSIFFRAFDIAFFVPGAILFCALLIFVVPSVQEINEDLSIANSTANLSDSTPEPIFWKRVWQMNEEHLSTIALTQIVGSLVCSYVLGLFCHSIAWSNLNRLTKRCNDERTSQSCRARLRRWLVGFSIQTDEMRGTGSVQNEIWTTEQTHYIQRADYFWYLRATCWNTSFAVGLSVAIGLWTCHPSPKVLWEIVGVTFFFCICMIQLGTKFGLSHDKRKMICKCLVDDHGGK